jgi:hypothetical protein
MVVVNKQTQMIKMAVFVVASILATFVDIAIDILNTCQQLFSSSPPQIEQKRIDFVNKLTHDHPSLDFTIIHQDLRTCLEKAAAILDFGNENIVVEVIQVEHCEGSGAEEVVSIRHLLRVFQTQAQV